MLTVCLYKYTNQVEGITIPTEMLAARAPQAKIDLAMVSIKLYLQRRSVLQRAVFSDLLQISTANRVHETSPNL